jgi:AraC-like DNA-binding protein
VPIKVWAHQKSMHFRTYRPASPLAGFVDYIWAYNGFDSPKLKERIFPTGTFEIVFNLQRDALRISQSLGSEPRRFSGAVVSGPYEAGFFTETTEEAAVIGVHFKPGGALPFLGISADEFANMHLDLGKIWGPAASETRERLFAATCSRQQFRLLENLLLARLRRPSEHHPAVALALEGFSKDNTRSVVRKLAREAGYSDRRFIDLFRVEVGLKPKLFNRIQRFQRLLAHVHRAAQPNWSELALNHGYFDQSHFIRDFVGFTGVSPADYVNRLNHFRTKDLRVKFNHLPLVR